MSTTVNYAGSGAEAQWRNTWLFEKLLRYGGGRRIGRTRKRTKHLGIAKGELARKWIGLRGRDRGSCWGRKKKKRQK